MISRLNVEEKPGYTQRGGAVFSTWYNGGLRTTTYFHNMIERGYRSFAYVMGGRVISACALIMINAFRSEIISVDTFLDEDKRKGYASSVCRVALNKALRNTDVVTWSTNASNLPSLMTAHALGFQPYYSVMENLISGELNFK